jgi:light-regulated signal transduction histidine kinase (bacteriophytochrome)
MAAPGNRGKYLGFVAHEIKNPLATALWSCDLLKRMDTTDRAGERAEKMIDVSLRALRRMRRLIDDFFTIERLLEHGYELRRDRLPLRALADAALQTLVEKDGMSVEGWSLVFDASEVTGDGEMLKRAVRALIEHLARGAADSKLSLTGRESVLLVRPNAPVAPLVPPVPEERPAGDPTGSVLGYVLAERILAAHGGRIEERDGGLLVTFPIS